MVSWDGWGVGGGEKIGPCATAVAAQVGAAGFKDEDEADDGRGIIFWYGD